MFEYFLSALIKFLLSPEMYVSYIVVRDAFAFLFTSLKTTEQIKEFIFKCLGQ